MRGGYRYYFCISPQGMLETQGPKRNTKINVQPRIARIVGSKKECQKRKSKKKCQNKCPTKDRQNRRVQKGMLETQGPKRNAKINIQPRIARIAGFKRKCQNEFSTQGHSYARRRQVLFLHFTTGNARNVGSKKKCKNICPTQVCQNRRVQKGMLETQGPKRNAKINMQTRIARILGFKRKCQNEFSTQGHS